MPLNRMMQSAVEELLERYSQAGYFPSASVQVFTSTDTLASACCGDATEDSLFDVASVTKIATTTGILKLIDEGLLHLEDEISHVLDEIASDPWLSERFARITVRKLLTHTSTLPAWYPFYAWQGEDFWIVLKSALHNQMPSTGVVYSDLNFILLGKIIERLRGMPLKKCLSLYVTEPLGIQYDLLYQPSMSRNIVPSSYDNAIEERMCKDRGIVFSHWRPRNIPVKGTVNDGNCHYYFGNVSGHAGVFSTAAAYVRLCQAYMNTEKQVFLDAQKEQPDSPDRGLGFETGTLYPHGCGHRGFTGTSIYFSREYNIGAVALTNRLFYTHPSEQNTNDFRRALHEAVFALSALTK